MKLVLVLALVSLVGVRVAEASCGGPIATVSPPDGAQLPVGATIYLFDPDHEANIHDHLAITNDVDGDPIKFRATKLDRSPSHHVHRIELWMLHSKDRRIGVRWKGAELAHYTLPGETEPGHAKVVDVTHVRDKWTCSFTDVVRIGVEGNAVAYRLDWEDDRPTVLPVSGHSTIELGHQSCVGYNVDPDLLSSPRAFELYALFADGREKRVGASIAALDEERARLPLELLRATEARIPRVITVLGTRDDVTGWIAASAALGGLAGAFVTRRRRRRNHDPRL